MIVIRLDENSFRLIYKKCSAVYNNFFVINREEEESQQNLRVDFCLDAITMNKYFQKIENKEQKDISDGLHNIIESVKNKETQAVEEFGPIHKYICELDKESKRFKEKLYLAFKTEQEVSLCPLTKIFRRILRNFWLKSRRIWVPLGKALGLTLRRWTVPKIIFSAALRSLWSISIRSII